MVEKVRKYIETFSMLQPGDHVVVGFSGGADSVCLLSVLKRLKDVLGISIQAIHIHHGLRGEEADRDASFSADFCEKMGIPFRLVREDVKGYAAAGGISEEEAGRLLRYRAFYQTAESTAGGDRWKIAVAHHQDDSAETVLLNLFRGTGLRGLGGIQPVRDKVVRPLLCVGRKEILCWLEQESLPFCEDSTNQEDDYTRNRLRNQILPSIQSQINQRAVDNILHVGMLARQADAYIEKKARRLLESQGIYREWGDGQRRMGFPKAALIQEDEVIQTYLIHQMLERMAEQKKDISSVHIHKVRELFTRPVGRMICLPYGLSAVSDYAHVWVETGKNEKNMCAHREKEDFSVETSTFPYEKGVEIPKNQYTKWFDYDKIKGTLSVRARETGDFITISGGRTKTVKSYMIDEKIPASRRGEIPVLAEDHHILWIIGYRISEHYKVTEETQTILQVIFIGGKDNGR